MPESSLMLWVPESDIAVVTATMPLEMTGSVVSGLHKAILQEQGYIGGHIRKTNMPVHVKRYKFEGVITGTFGKISPGHHSMFTEGLNFTSYDANDVRYHLGSRTTSERYGYERIEVPVSDLGIDLDGFVSAALEMYAFLGIPDRVTNERDRHLLFYARTDIDRNRNS